MMPLLRAGAGPTGVLIQADGPVAWAGKGANESLHGLTNRFARANREPLTNGRGSGGERSDPARRRSWSDAFLSHDRHRSPLATSEPVW